MKTPATRKPPRIGALFKKDDPALSRWMAQAREAINWLSDNAVTSLAAGARAGAVAVLGTNVFDSNGNLVTRIGSDLIESGAVTGDHMADDSISADALQDDSVTDSHIQAGSIQTQHIDSQVINDDHVVEDQSLVASGGVTTALAIDISVAATDAGSGIETVVNADTVYLNDGAGLGTTADLTQTQNIPPDVATAIALGMLTDAQPSIGVGAAVRNVLFSDGSFPYWADIFSGVVDGGVMGGANFLAADTVMTGSMATYGNKFVLANIFPGAITVLAFAQANFFTSAGTGGGANAGTVQLQISLDGGSTWNTSAQLGSTRIPDVNHTYPAGLCMHSVSGTPTGSVQIRLQAEQSSGTDTLKLQAGTSALAYVILNSSNGIIAGTANLAASIPSTASASATSTYPSTSGTYHKNITITVTGGLPPYTPSTAKTAGTGTVSGSTSITFTVSDTETTTFAGATHTTTVQSTVMDSQAYTMNTGATESGTTVTGTLTAGALIPVGATFRMQNVVAAGYNGTGLPAVAGTTGTTLKYTAGSSGLAASTHTGAVDQVTVATGSCVVTGTFTLAYSSVTVAINGTKGGSCNANSGSCTVTLTLTNKPSGGDGSYTRSNSKTGGTYTLSGSTSATFTCADSHSVVGDPQTTGTVHCQATDGHSNTGSTNASLSFQFNDLS